MFHNCEYGFFDIYRLLFSLAGGVPWLRLLLILFIIVHTEPLSLTYSVDID